MDDGEVLVRRVKVWAEFEVVPKPVQCDTCRLGSVEVRDTVAGFLCLECWIHLPRCVECEWGPGTVAFVEKCYCAGCLNPEPSEEYLREERERIITGRRRHPLSDIKERG